MKQKKVSVPKKRPILLLKSRQAMKGHKPKKKECTRCQIKKWFSEFNITHKPGRGYSYRSECKTCEAKWRMKNDFEKMKVAVEKKRRQIVPLAVKVKEYYEKNREQCAQYRQRKQLKQPGYFKNRMRYIRDTRKRENKQAREALDDKDCL